MVFNPEITDKTMNKYSVNTEHLPRRLPNSGGRRFASRDCAVIDPGAPNAGLDGRKGGGAAFPSGSLSLNVEWSILRCSQHFLEARGICDLRG
jgi:hypothetical protein